MGLDTIDTALGTIDAAFRGLTIYTNSTSNVELSKDIASSTETCFGAFQETFPPGFSRSCRGRAPVAQETVVE